MYHFEICTMAFISKDLLYSIVLHFHVNSSIFFFLMIYLNMISPEGKPYFEEKLLCVQIMSFSLTNNVLN